MEKESLPNSETLQGKEKNANVCHFMGNEIGMPKSVTVRNACDNKKRMSKYVSVGNA